MRLIIPIIVVVIGGGIFFLFTKPMYGDVQTLRAQEATYDEALRHAVELAAIRDRLISSYNSLTADEIDRIEVMLPDTIDNVRLVLDVDAVAAEYGLTLSGLGFGGDAMESVEGENTQTVGTLTMSFNVEASYETMQEFLSDLEESLRILDITSIAFSGNEDGLNTYNVTLQTYWLK